MADTNEEGGHGDHVLPACRSPKVCFVVFPWWFRPLMLGVPRNGSRGLFVKVTLRSRDPQATASLGRRKASAHLDFRKTPGSCVGWVEGGGQGPETSVEAFPSTG